MCIRVHLCKAFLSLPTANTHTGHPAQPGRPTPETAIGVSLDERARGGGHVSGANGLIRNSNYGIAEQCQGRLLEEIRKAGMKVIPLAYDGRVTVDFRTA